MEYINKSYPAMGTINQFQLWGNNLDKSLDKIVNCLYDIEKRMSYFLEDSEISKLNQNAGEQFIKLSDDTYHIIETAKYYARISDGIFDPTIRPISDLWSFSNTSPSKQIISEVISLVNWQDIILKSSSKEVMLLNKGQKIDLGAIAKGYVGDAIIKILKDDGVFSALINLGGDVISFGSKENYESFKIGIQDPFNERGVFIGIIEADNDAIVTSGVYEKFNSKIGNHAHHLIDATTAQPSTSNFVSSTIITKSAMHGDVIATTTLLVGEDNYETYLSQFDNVESILITKDKKIYLSSNLRNRFILTSSEYTVI